MPSNGHTLPQVIGYNARRLRGPHTLEEVAFQAKRIGAQWSSGSVSTIELGRAKSTLENLVFLGLALASLRGEKTAIPISEFLSTAHLGGREGKVSETVDISIVELLEWINGGELLTLPNLRNVEQMNKNRDDILNQLLPNGRNFPDMPTPAETRLAKKAGISPVELRVWSLRLWGTSFEFRRDQVAGPGSTPQKKGRVSRELLEEIQTAMKEHRGND